jgi:NADH:flavin oxidoreductase / NADH oxidase family
MRPQKITLRGRAGLLIGLQVQPLPAARDVLEDAAQIIAEGSADLVSMARPLLADAEFVNKVRRGRPGLVNVCIACNQACLDHYFTDQVITCLTGATNSVVHTVDCCNFSLGFSPIFPIIRSGNRLAAGA